jgi:Ulp1 family protease
MDRLKARTIVNYDIESVKSGGWISDKVVDWCLRKILCDLHCSAAFISSLCSSKIWEHKCKNNREVEEQLNLVITKYNTTHSDQYDIKSFDLSCYQTNYHIGQEDIFNMKAILFPIAHDHHWFLLCVLMTTQSQPSPYYPILLLDSMYKGKESDYSDYADALRSYLSCYYICGPHSSSSPLLFDKSISPLVYMKMPQQNDGYNCGIYLIQIARALLTEIDRNGFQNILESINGDHSYFEKSFIGKSSCKKFREDFENIIKTKGNEIER